LGGAIISPFFWSATGSVAISNIAEEATEPVALEKIGTKALSLRNSPG